MSPSNLAEILALALLNCVTVVSKSLVPSVKWEENGKKKDYDANDYDENDVTCH